MNSSEPVTRINGTRQSLTDVESLLRRSAIVGCHRQCTFIVPFYWLNVKSGKMWLQTHWKFITEVVFLRFFDVLLIAGVISNRLIYHWYATPNIVVGPINSYFTINFQWVLLSIMFLRVVVTDRAWIIPIDSNWTWNYDDSFHCVTEQKTFACKFAPGFVDTFSVLLGDSFKMENWSICLSWMAWKFEFLFKRKFACPL